MKDSDKFMGLNRRICAILLWERHRLTAKEFESTRLESTIYSLINPPIFFNDDGKFITHEIETEELREFLKKLIKLWKENETWWTDKASGLERSMKMYQDELEQNYNTLIDERIIQGIIE